MDKSLRHKVMGWIFPRACEERRKLRVELAKHRRASTRLARTADATATAVAAATIEGDITVEGDVNVDVNVEVTSGIE